MRKLHTWVAVVGLAAVGGAAWWWQQRPAAPIDGRVVAPGPGASRPSATAAPSGPAAVEVAKAELMRIEDDAQAVGTLRAVQTIVVRPEVSGRVVRLGFTDGQAVRRGQTLLQLDDQLQRAQLQQAEAQAAIARTNLQRSRELLAQNFVSQSAVDQNAAALDVAMAQVALAKAQLARMVVAAPFDGVAGIRSVSVGDYLKDGADVVSLEDRSRLWVDFRLPERFVGATRPGLPVSFTLDSMPGKPYLGTVEALDSLVDANGRSLLVRARIDKPGTELKSGMFARARIVFAVRERAVMVPEEAIVPFGGKQYVFKLVDAPAGAASAADNGRGSGKLAQRLEARLGVRHAGKVEILDGIAAGDAVVTAGQQRLQRGDMQPVRVVDLARAGGRSGGAASAPAGASAPKSAAPA